MPVVVLTLAFDHEMEQAVQWLWDRLRHQGIAEAGPPRHRPHITAAAHDVLDVESLCAALLAVTQQRVVFPIRLHALGVFPETGTVFLAPRMTETLLEAHRDLHYFLAPRWGTTLNPEHLLPDAWTPHCTVAARLSPDDVARTIRLCLEHWHPLEGRVESVGVLVLPATRDHYQAPYFTTPFQADF